MEAQTALMEMIETGAVVILPLGVAVIPCICRIDAQVPYLPMDLADAALVCVAERDDCDGVHHRPAGFSDLSSLENRLVCGASVTLNPSNLRRCKVEWAGDKPLPAPIELQVYLRAPSR